MRTKARRFLFEAATWIFCLQDTAGAAEDQRRIKLVDFASYCGLERNNGSHLRITVGQTELRLPGPSPPLVLRCSSGRSCAVVGHHDIVGADERNDYLAFPGFVRTAPSSATWTANRLAGSLALAFSLTK
jgi:hypothetical protein